jgi:hypothetical protein
VYSVFTQTSFFSSFRITVNVVYSLVLLKNNNQLMLFSGLGPIATSKTLGRIHQTVFFLLVTSCHR